MASDTRIRRIASILKNVPLLATLNTEEREKLAAKLKIQAVPDKHQILKQGAVGDEFFIITKGEVVVTRENEQGVTAELGRLKAGDYFGETALLNNTTRGATITANGSVTLFYLTRVKFNSLFSKNRLNVQFAKRNAVSAGNQKNLKYTPKMPANATKTKSAATKQLILKAVQRNVLFLELDRDQTMQIIDEMYRTEISEGVNAVKQGDLGDNLYVVESGEFHVFVKGSYVGTLGAGTCFGELALMYNSPRAATVTAVTDTAVWVVDRFTFRRVVTGLTRRKFDLYVQFLKQVPLLAPLAAYERRKIAEALEEFTYQSGEIVFNQGDVGDSMYIVHSGEAIVTITGKAGTTEVNRIQPGSYFGERALIKNETRAATITAGGNLRVLKLDNLAFQLLLGPLEDILKQKVESYEDVKEVASLATDMKKSKITEASRADSTHDVEFNDLKLIGTLGKGSFGHVTLMQHRRTKNTYALKAVNKTQIVQTGQQSHIMSEKKVMAAMNHPFLIKLYKTFQDNDRLYFLLEPSLGGELFSVLREKTFFSENTARFYAGSVVCAFEYMHNMNFIYRDLKPENLLLDSKGVMKVTDFGFAKDVSSGRTWTLCGTPDYLAPEIVAGKGHGKGVDWWTLGIFIYEMLASYPPFFDEDPMKTYAKIMHGRINYPSHFSKESISLVKKLLHPKAIKRLGVVRGGAKLIKKHSWFHGFDWESLVDMTMAAPIVPKIKNDLDISNFDTYDEDDEIMFYEDDGTGWADEF